MDLKAEHISLGSHRTSSNSNHRPTRADTTTPTRPSGTESISERSSSSSVPKESSASNSTLPEHLMLAYRKAKGKESDRKSARSPPRVSERRTNDYQPGRRRPHKDSDGKKDFRTFGDYSAQEISQVSFATIFGLSHRDAITTKIRSRDPFIRYSNSYLAET